MNSVFLVLFSIFIHFIMCLNSCSDFFSKDFVDEVNSLQTTWTAGYNNLPFAYSNIQFKDYENVSSNHLFYQKDTQSDNDIQVDQFSSDPLVTRGAFIFKIGRNLKQSRKKKTLLKRTGDYSILPFVSKIDENLPEDFDLRKMYPYCHSLRQISDQGSCGSCWAVSAVDSMTDRQCILSKGKQRFRYSAANLVNCCAECGRGCRGGSHRSAWKYWVLNGIVSGGFYGSGIGCQPYQFKPCEHRIPGPRAQCQKYGKTPKCELSCQPAYDISYQQDLHFGLSAYSIIPNEAAIRTEIYRHGSVQASLKLFADFFTYKKGIYYHVKGRFLDDHAVRIIGWGYSKKKKMPYWIVANSFNSNWGNKGFFLIKRGSNECNIEADVTGGIPNFN